MGTTGIEFATKTWNFLTGCFPMSEGCRNCWAERGHEMRHKAYLEGKKLPAQYAKPFSEIQVFPNRLTEPMHWRQPQRVFPCATSDIALAPETILDQAFAVMSLTPQHFYMLITKRPDLLHNYLVDPDCRTRVWNAKCDHGKPVTPMPWPLPNVIIMTTAENQEIADNRIPCVLKSPAALRGVIIEPMLGPVNIMAYLGGKFLTDIEKQTGSVTGLDWVICGGESGPGARPMHPEWVWSLRDQCKAAGVPFLFKQFGEWLPFGQNTVEGKHHFGFDGDQGFWKVGKKAAGRLLDGHLWDQYPR